MNISISGLDVCGTNLNETNVTLQNSTGSIKRLRVDLVRKCKQTKTLLILSHCNNSDVWPSIECGLSLFNFLIENEN